MTSVQKYTRRTFASEIGAEADPRLARAVGGLLIYGAAAVAAVPFVVTALFADEQPLLWLLYIVPIALLAFAFDAGYRVVVAARAATEREDSAAQVVDRKRQLRGGLKAILNELYYIAERLFDNDRRGLAWTGPPLPNQE